MVENYFVEARRRNKTKFLQFIGEHKDLTKRTIIGKFSWDTGFRKAVLEEWWEEMQDAGLIKIDEYGVVC